MIQAEVPANSLGPKGPAAAAGCGGGNTNNQTTTSTSIASTPTKKKQPPAISTDVNDQLSSGSGPLPSSTSTGTDRSEFRQAQTPKHCNKAAGTTSSIGGKIGAIRPGGGPAGVGSPRLAPGLGMGPKQQQHQQLWPPQNTGFAHHFQGQQPSPHHQHHPGRPGHGGGHPGAGGGGGYYSAQPPQQSHYPTGQPHPNYGPGGPPPPHQMHSPHSMQGGAPTTPPGGVFEQQPYNTHTGYNGPPPTVSPGSFRGGLLPPHLGGVPGSSSWEQQQMQQMQLQQQMQEQQQYGGYPRGGPQGYHASNIPMAPYHVGPPGPSGRPHPSQMTQQQQHHHHHQLQQQQESATFSRTISSSFENLKSKGSDDSKDESGDNGKNNSSSNNKPAALSHDLHAYNSAQNHHGGAGAGAADANNDDSSAGAASDHSWGMLHQVQSVDEAQMKAANEAKKLDEAKKAEEKNNKRDKNKEQQRASTHTPTGQAQTSHSAAALSNLGSASSLSNSSGQPKQQYHIPPADKVYPPLPTPSKLANLDSLSSVASIQEPMDTSGADAPDLLQCGTGSSGSLLFPMTTSSSRHVRGNSLDHPIAPHDLIGAGSKRGREERGDAEGQRCGLDDIRKAASSVSDDVADDAKDRPTKKGKTTTAAKSDPKNVGKDPKEKKELSEKGGKASPLSISCTPPSSPKAKPPAVATLSTTDQPNKLSHLTASPGIPNYSFSIESMPSFSKEAGKMGSYPAGLPPRPGSVSSGSIGLPQKGMSNPGPDDIPHSMPSWEIHGQDSFIGGMSVGSGGSGGQGQGLFSSFSFTNDYHMLTQGSGYPAGAIPGQGAAQDATANKPHTKGTKDQDMQKGDKKKPRKQGPPPMQHQYQQQQHPLESRNQSFDQAMANQHRGQSGVISRSGTFDTAYTMSSIPAVPSWGSVGGPRAMHSPGGTQYPPHAQSWSSAGSGGPTYSHHPGYPPRGQMYSPRQMPMSRTFTEDSSKSSPGYHKPGVPNAFQPPPPEFGVPQGQIGKRPPPTVYIMPTAPGAAPAPGTGTRPAPRSYGNGAMAKQAGSGSGRAVFNWSKEDDSKLAEIMKKYKNPRDWEPIAREHARGKSSKECHERWIRYLKPGVRKGQWTDQEDAIVVEAVTTSTEQPFTRWSDLAQRLPGRVGKQIRDRWVNHLNPNINHMPFSRDDDLLLWEGHKKFGKRWVEISTKCFESSRSENHIKNRWYSASFKKFIANEFGAEAYAATAGVSGKQGKAKKATKAKE